MSAAAAAEAHSLGTAEQIHSVLKASHVSDAGLQQPALPT